MVVAPPTRQSIRQVAHARQGQHFEAPDMTGVMRNGSSPQSSSACAKPR